MANLRVHPYLHFYSEDHAGHPLVEVHQVSHWLHEIADNQLTPMACICQKDHFIHELEWHGVWYSRYNTHSGAGNRPQWWQKQHGKLLRLLKWFHWEWWWPKWWELCDSTCSASRCLRLWWTQCSAWRCLLRYGWSSFLLLLCCLNLKTLVAWVIPFKRGDDHRSALTFWWSMCVT